MDKRRKEVERLFRRLKGFRRIFSRFDKLDAMFLAFINFALIVDGLKWCDQALVRPLLTSRSGSTPLPFRA